MNNKANIIKEDNRNFDYLYFARAYLIIAFLGTEKVLQDIKIKNEKYNNPLAKEEGDKLFPDFVLMNKYLIAPILYNVKHSIEVFLKSTSLFLGDDFEEKHDLKLLFSKIKIKLSKLNLSEKEKNLLIEKVEQLEKLIIKFHQNVFLKNKIAGNFIMEDIMNDVFRYPDNKAKISLDFFNIFHQFTASEIQEIQNDLRNLYELFYEVGKTILEEKHGARFRIYKIDYGQTRKDCNLTNPPISHTICP